MALSSQRLLRFFFFLGLLTKMDFHVSSSLVGAGKASATGITSERFFTRVCSDVRGKMIGAGEISHTDATLERFLPGVSSHMAGKLIRTRETTRTRFNGASIRSFTWRCFCPLRELVVALHFQNTATSFCGSVVVVWDRFDDFHDVVV